MRLYIYIILCAALIAIGWFARGERIQKQIVYVQAEQAKEVEKVEKKKVEREIVYVDRLRVIHESTADCLSQPIPVEFLPILRSSSTESESDERLRYANINWRDLP